MKLYPGSATVSLPSDTEILIERRFDAPVLRVFAAFTTPEHIRRWWGFPTSEMIVCENDLRVGGAWRYVTREADGTEYGWHGECLELDAPHRMVSTEVFEGFPDAVAVNTARFTDEAGATRLTVNVRHLTRENRDGHLNAGMETGMQITFNRLEELLTTLT
jgi:uncharacterized protein YndB with AHSA1/START domain